MATLQMMKLLLRGMHCSGPCNCHGDSPIQKRAAAVARSSSHRVTLKKLLDKSPTRRALPSAQPSAVEKKGAKGMLGRSTLRDLFVSSPPASGGEVDGTETASAIRMGSERRARGALRVRSLSLRQRLQRRDWRPVLGAIPE